MLHKFRKIAKYTTPIKTEIDPNSIFVFIGVCVSKIFAVEQKLNSGKLQNQKLYATIRLGVAQAVAVILLVSLL